MAPTIFKRIIDGEIPADIVYQDERCLAFRDVSPQAPVHILVIPRREIPSLADLQSEDELLVGHLLFVAAEIARQEKLANGYRIVVNCGPHGGQSVDHLHVHILGGRQMLWPPG